MFKIGDKVTLIPDTNNINYFKSHFGGASHERVYTVHTINRGDIRDCISLEECGNVCIRYTRFRLASNIQLPDDLFTI